MEQNTKSRKIVNTAFCVAILCILSMVTVPLGEVPYSFSLLGVFLIGIVLSPMYAGIACACYLLLGIIGIPVFANFTGGLGVLMGPTGGFLFAYPFMAMLVSLLHKKIKRNPNIGFLLGMLLSLVLGYAMGTVWFLLVSHCSFQTAVTMCVFPFLGVDIIKVLLSFSVFPKLPVMK